MKQRLSALWIGALIAGGLQVVAPAPAAAGHCGVPTGEYCATVYSGFGFHNQFEICTMLVSGPSFSQDYGTGGPSCAPSRTDFFGIRFEGDFDLSGGLWRIDGFSDDGIRIFVDGVKILDLWTQRSAPYASDTFRIAAGLHRIRIEYFEQTGSARVSANLVQLDTVPLDPTPPEIAPTVTPAANTDGWHNTNPTVSWSVTDPETGISSTSGCGTTTVSSESPGTTLTCSATNGHGVSSSDSVTVRLDKTSPTVSGSLSPAPNAAGWNNTEVTVSFTCADSLSGVAACDAPVALSAEGAGQPVSGSAVDLAGNTASTTVSVNIDKTGPSTTVTPLPVVVRALDQTIDGAALDNLSGAASTEVTLVPILVGVPVALAATCTSGCGTTTATWSLTVPADVAPGPYLATADSDDVAGNAGAASPTAQIIIV